LPLKLASSLRRLLSRPLAYPATSENGLSRTRSIGNVCGEGTVAYKYGVRTLDAGEPLDVAKDRLLGALAVAAAASLWGTLGFFAKILYAQGVSFEALGGLLVLVGAALAQVRPGKAPPRSGPA
jgi:hypothetical protein